jgi:hypothetical protein
MVVHTQNKDNKSKKKNTFKTTASTPTGDNAGLIFAAVVVPAGDASRYFS